MSDKVFEQHLLCEMPIVEKNVHASNKEYYIRGEVDSNIAEYNGRIYFVKRQDWGESAYLCSTDVKGEDIVILAEVKEDFAFGYVHANITGIYLYTMMDYARIRVEHYSFLGKFISECKEEYEGGYEDGHHFSNIYFYDNALYYVYSRENIGRRICLIKQMQIDLNRIEVLYDKAVEIDKLYATANELIFYATYENDECVESSMSGWMMLDLLGKNVECLSNPFCSPENVVDQPEVYDEDSLLYNDNWYYDRNIKCFDLTRFIFWTERKEEEWDGTQKVIVIYREPHKLMGDKDAVVRDLPIWKIPGADLYGQREYFDGTHLYYAECYYFFKSMTKYGEVEDWSLENHGHGRCDEFKVVGDYLYLDVDALGEMQYGMTIGASAPIRKSWFAESLPSDVIERFRNQGEVSELPTEKKSNSREMFSWIDRASQESALNDEDDLEAFFRKATKPVVDDTFADIKVGKLAQTTFREILESGKVPLEELISLQDVAYSKQTFGLNFPVLVRLGCFFDKVRYYSKPVAINGTNYMICSQWFDKNKAALVAWIKKYS